MHAPAAVATRTSSPTSDPTYRPDIDGLRAIAVLSVVAFHAFPKAVPGGFVGVDIFFVISGFLITSIIVDGLATDRFSFAMFYMRRIRRIFPALIVVTLTCLVVGWFVLLPEEFRRLGKHVVAGAAFLSNFALWREASYFDVTSDAKVLLHLWSLGIEEQFYLIWPALLALAWRVRLNLLLVIAAVLAVSLAYSVKTTFSNQVAAFYSPAARFWELAAGALLTQLAPSPSNLLALIGLQAAPAEPRAGIGPLQANLLSAAGLAAVVGSLFVITQRNHFPGWWALLPVIGACATILAGPRAWLNRAVLGNPAIVGIGLISYPLYLWHWPLLSLARLHLHHDISAGARATLVAAGIALPWLTYQFVEKPIRFGLAPRRAAPALAAAMLAVAALGAIVLVEDGFPERLAKDRRDYAQFFDRGSQRTVDEARLINQLPCNFYSYDSPVQTRAPRSVDPQCYTRHSAKSVLIIGDSNGADLFYGLKEVLPNDVSVLLLYSSGCGVREFSEQAIQTDHCDMANYFVLNRIKADPPDVVMMSSYNSYDIDYIRKYSTAIKSYGVKHVLVLGQRPHWRYDLYHIILNEFWAYTPRYIPGYLDDGLHAPGKRFEAQLRPDEPFEFVDEMQPFCNAEGCLAYLGDNRREGLITADTAHLRPHASVWLAQQQLAPLIMKRIGR